MPREVLEGILAAATWAPSAHNRQPWRFAVITSSTVRQDLALAMGARLRADPVEDLVEQQRDEEHALRLREMRDRGDRDALLAALRPQQLPDIQRNALEPGVEARRGEEVVHLDGELLALLRGVEGFDVHRAHARHRRLLDLRDQRAQVETLTSAPRPREEIRQQDVLAALERIGGDPE